MGSKRGMRVDRAAAALRTYRAGGWPLVVHDRGLERTVARSELGWQRRGPVTMNATRRILVPTAFSSCAAGALDLATEMAKAFGAEITLLHVVAVPVRYAPFPLVPLPSEWLQSMRDEARVRLDGERTRVAPPAKGEVRDGATDEAVLAAAEEGGHDLIVMGTHGWNGFKHALLGSVAERVVRRAKVPVMTIRGRE